MAKRSTRNRRAESSLAVERFEWPAALVILLATLFAYAPAWHGGYISDDEIYLADNPLLLTWQGLVQIWSQPGATDQYYPLTMTSFWLEFHLWQLNPVGYHVDNITLHAIDALLVWRILLRLAVPGAWFAAALFALHPVCVESVAWIAERKNTLSAFFFLGSLFFALDFWKLRRPAAHHEKKDWRVFWLSFAFYLCAVLSKSAAVPLPAVIALLIWWKRSKLSPRDLYPLVPFFAAGFGMGAVTLYVEQHVVHSTGPLWNLSPPERAILIGRALWFYLGKLIWPYPLVFMYPRWTLNSGNPAQYLPLAAAIGGLAFLWAKRNTVLRPVFVAAAWFVLMLSPVCGTFNQYYFRYSFVADHLQYLACLGPLALFAAGVTTGMGWFKSIPVSSAYAVILVVLALLTFRQSALYVDGETLWRATIAENPTGWAPHNNLGEILATSGRDAEAFAEFTEAVRVDPKSGPAHNSLGNALLLSHHNDEAIAEFQQAITLEPDFAQAHSNLGVALYQAGRTADAIAEFHRALQLDPMCTDATENLRRIQGTGN